MISEKKTQTKTKQIVQQVFSSLIKVCTFPFQMKGTHHIPVQLCVRVCRRHNVFFRVEELW